MARRRHRGIIAIAAFVLGAIANPRPSRAAGHELQLHAGPSAFASTWRGDYGAGGTLRLGWRWKRIVGVDFQGWESLSRVDTRLNTGLSLGIRGGIPLGPVRPFARLFVVHQHEEGVASARADPLGTVAGVGAGIRHRAGGGGALGIEVPLRRVGDKTAFTLFSQANATHLTNDLGPPWYFGLDLGVGVDVDL